MKNEAPYVVGAISSLLAGSFPSRALELIVLDGGSTDGSRNLVEKLAASDSRIRLLGGQFTPHAAALNAGIEAARGSIIVRADCHATYGSEYISRIVDRLQDRSIGNVGGVQEAAGSGFVGRAIAAAMTSPFGVGNAYFRYTRVERESDTVFLGAWRKEILDEVGRFDVGWLVNEDYELNRRILDAGYRIVVDPEIKCLYYARSSLRSLSRQYLRYGFWRAKTIARYPHTLTFRQLAPASMIVGTLGLVGLSIAWRWYAALPLAAYLAAGIVASMAATGIRRLPSAPIVLTAFLVMHWAYGIGSIMGAFHFVGAAKKRGGR